MSLRFMLAMVGICLTGSPAHGQQWRLVEEWRVGGEVEGAYSFLDVRGLELLPNRGIVVLEFKDQQVHFLDARGRHVRTVGRQGAGPGEYQNANGLVVLPSGDLVINDPDNNRFTVLGPSGDFIRTVPMSHPRGFGWMWEAWADPSGLLVENIRIRRGEDLTIARQVWSRDFATSDTLHAAECSPSPRPPRENWFYSFRSARGGTSMVIPFIGPRTVLLHTADGGVWAAAWPGFSEIAHTPAGRCIPDVTISLSGERVPIPKVVRDSVIKRVMEVAGGHGPQQPDLELIPRTFPPFDVMKLDRVGQLWVVRQRGPTERRFEVYGSNGARVATLDVPSRLEPLRPMIITADRVYGFVTDEDELPYLVAWRIVKGGE